MEICCTYSLLKAKELTSAGILMNYNRSCHSKYYSVFKWECKFTLGLNDDQKIVQKKKKNSSELNFVQKS